MKPARGTRLVIGFALLLMGMRPLAAAEGTPLLPLILPAPEGISPSSPPDLENLPDLEMATSPWATTAAKAEVAPALALADRIAPLPRPAAPLETGVDGSVQVAGKTPPGDEFTNGCLPPRSWKNIHVPKTLMALQDQVGEGFLLARRGPFLIASDLESSSFSMLADGVLACCRECLGHDFFDAVPDQLITIYAFRDEKTYLASLNRLFGMKPISPYGHYGHSRRYIVVNYDTGPGTLVHELTHALMAPDFPEAPIWISEGMASLYEQCRVEGESLVGENNWRLPELQKALESPNGIAPLRQLFTMRPTAFRAQGESLHYAMSRYFCKYLEDQGALRTVYKNFRDRYVADPTGVQFVEEVLGKRIDQVEHDWHAWLRTQRWK